MPEPTVADRREALGDELQMIAAEWEARDIAPNVDWLWLSRRLRVAADQAERLAAETGDGR